jgi:hypothetical protein
VSYGLSGFLLATSGLLDARTSLSILGKNDLRDFHGDNVGSKPAGDAKFYIFLLTTHPSHAKNPALIETSRARVPGAAITVNNVHNNLRLDAKMSAVNGLSISDLALGTHEVHIENTGFDVADPRQIALSLRLIF